MKKIIKGALFNTQTAKLIGEWHNEFPSKDYNYCEESLYRTKSGKYFIYGQGGARTKYAERCGNNEWSEGDILFDLSRDAAKEWAQENLTVDKYEIIFGELTEDEGDNKEHLNVNISISLKNKLWKVAEERNMSISILVEEILGREF
ncbi:MAG TPA: hypothetical protein VIK86_04300 [Candidatus Paceibacterota bacterium]